MSDKWDEKARGIAETIERRWTAEEDEVALYAERDYVPIAQALRDAYAQGQADRDEKVAKLVEAAERAVRYMDDLWNQLRAVEEEPSWQATEDLRDALAAIQSDEALRRKLEGK